MIVTMDGPAGSGKSTTARLLARKLGLAYLDTGAMYRAVTVEGLRRGIDLADADALARVAEEIRIDLEPTADGLRVTVDGRDVTSAIRDNEISRQAHYAACNEQVRACLVRAQQEIGRRWGDLVTEGRDQGSVVFPQAELKIYLDADERVRARRRQKELAARGKDVPLDQLLDEIRRRDHSDRSRAVGPLKVADGAVIVDTSDMTVDEVVEHLAAMARQRQS
jgi:cytidylate kinase